jgi:DNA-binding transcriptional ArsR family regulator
MVTAPPRTHSSPNSPPSARHWATPTRLELLDLLDQGPRSVDDLATAAQVGVSTCSAHLHTLREAGLPHTRRQEEYEHAR